MPTRSQAPAPPGYLPPEKIKSIFETQIKRGLKAPRQDSPVALFMVGQPGAGKTSAQRPLLHILGHDDAVSVDGDDLYAHHPEYQILALRDDFKALGQCGSAVRVWTAMATEYVTENRSNIVQPMFIDESNRNVLNRYKSMGYHVEVAFIAVDDIRSAQGVSARYLQSREDVGYGRMADTSNEWYRGVLGIADLADQVADAVHVVRRGGEILYTRHGRPQRSGVTRVRIEAERNRPWTEREKWEFTATQQLTEQLAEKYKGDLPKYKRDLPKGDLPKCKGDLPKFVGLIGERAMKEKSLPAPELVSYNTAVAARNLTVQPPTSYAPQSSVGGYNLPQPRPTLSWEVADVVSPGAPRWTGGYPQVGPPQGGYQQVGYPASGPVNQGGVCPLDVMTSNQSGSHYGNSSSRSGYHNQSNPSRGR